MKKVGKAYGFFDCKASKKDIEAELPSIRNMVRTPSRLELSLIEGVENLMGDLDSTPIIREARDSGMKYVFEATYPDATNEKTADEVAAILNQAYQSPLYQKSEPFSGGIVYKEGNRYIFRD